MIVPFIAAQLLAHVLADFCFQTGTMCCSKSEKIFYSRALYLHVALVLVLSWLMAPTWGFGWYALVIAVTHFLIDGVKAEVARKWSGSHVIVFIADQALHVTIIGIVALLYLKNNPGCWPWAAAGRIWVILLGYVLCMKPANVFLQVLLDGFHINSQPGEQELLNAGKLIGIFERLMVITFVLVNQYSAIGFLIAAKSIIRYKDSEKPKTEYVLIGTLYSFGIAVLSGVIVNSMI